MSNPFARAVADRRGVALPVALFGLVAVSLVVTTALLTSSTEFAISAAHRGAAASLYNADAALENYVFTRIRQQGAARAFIEPTPAGQAGRAQAPDGSWYTVQVARLSWTRNDPAATPNRVGATEVYSLVAQPEPAAAGQAGRGRAVGAFLRVRLQARRLSTNINAGATSGGDLEVSGNATISDGRSGTNYCQAADSTSDYAVQVTRDARIELKGKAEDNLEGVADTADFKKDSLAHHVLGPDVTLTTLADQADVKFGARWRADPFETRVILSDSGQVPEYDWGCPQQLLSDPCPGTSASRFKVVAIDAGGGTVRINGRYGQGMLIVLNGSLEIQGNFTYKGIILVERDMFIRGGAQGEESKIEGSVISFGSSSAVEDNITGTATIKYNICAIRDAEEAMNAGALRNAPQQRVGTTFAWYELIR